jgi:hypothetical protein
MHPVVAAAAKCGLERLRAGERLDDVLHTFRERELHVIGSLQALMAICRIGLLAARDLVETAQMGQARPHIGLAELEQLARMRHLPSLGLHSRVHRDLESAIIEGRPEITFLPDLPGTVRFYTVDAAGEAHMGTTHRDGLSLDAIREDYRRATADAVWTTEVQIFVRCPAEARTARLPGGQLAVELAEI